MPFHESGYRAEGIKFFLNLASAAGGAVILKGRGVGTIVNHD